MKHLRYLAAACLATPHASQSFGGLDDSQMIGVGICCAIVAAVCGVKYMSSTSDKTDSDKDKRETAADAIEASVSPPMVGSGAATTLSWLSRRKVLYIAGATAAVLAAGYGGYHMLGAAASASGSAAANALQAAAVSAGTPPAPHTDDQTPAAGAANAPVAEGTSTVGESGPQTDSGSEAPAPAAAPAQSQHTPQQDQ